MDHKIIITIAREYGSGGREIGKQLAEQLKIPFYDKELITRTAEESGIDPDLFENADEKPSNPFWTSLAFNIGTFGSHIPTINDLPMNDRLFLLQSKTIRKIAEEGSCVIVGRCADYILEKEENIIRFFIHADREDKLNRVIHSYGIPEEGAQEFMKKTDRRRATYYDYYVGEKWGQINRYDLSINSSTLGIQSTVDLLLKFVKQINA
ncbi:cytidylate kinase-like family protein [Sinanaerobacter sp. ZZT-01]|uniref:cytidylate kinase-like family protein n=1 Tax=Sinanaerobacter sp. ZZT-01 TaxID=3111540 RepID=UPI002D7905C1|nr:cytidylate kinase-like family protein [Sinanaerobacter sp. ZZT-01]WRR92866.1 cytidylate kinase-like family protein [Sinanaerobacter sp. ZZT-01]